MQLNYCLSAQKEEAEREFKGSLNFGVVFLCHLMSQHHILFCKHKKAGIDFENKIEKKLGFLSHSRAAALRQVPYVPRLAN